MLAAPQAQPALDIPLTLGVSGGWLALSLAHADLARTDCPCRASQVNAFDAWALDLDADTEPEADALAGLSLALPFAALALTSPDWSNDAVLVAESAAVSGLLTQAIKTAIARPYPYMHPADHPEQDADGVNYASFPSGHTAVPMAAAISYAYLLQRRRSRWRYLAWTLGPALALGAGALQVGARNHFPSDVIAGAALGAGVGVLTPWLHE